MEKITPPKVKVLATGTQLVAKQMAGSAGDVMPKHLADAESVLFVHEGECVIEIDGEEKILKPGEAIVIPTQTLHQIKAITDYSGVHIMPNDIKFQFFK